MGKAKGNKAKIDVKQFLLAKGEYLVLGGSALFTLILLVMAAAKWSSAKDPTKISGEMMSKAQLVHTNIANGPINPDDEKAAALPEWVVKPNTYPVVPVSEFKATGPQFDPIAKPDTKKENPLVFPIGAHQVDLTRAPMKGYDIIYNNEGLARIAVLAPQKGGKLDTEKVKAVGEVLKFRAKGGSAVAQKTGAGAAKDKDAGTDAFGRAGATGYDAGAQRLAVEYVPLDELDKATEKGKVPAMTVIPLRMITLHAEIPYKKQLEEIKRALRLPTLADAQQWGPIYDGYEVQRRVTRVLSSGKTEVVQDWVEYKFEDKYVELINSRKLGDNFEDGYLSYFIKYEMALALPLPQLVPELGQYPAIRLPSINETIKKLINANRPKVEASDTAKRLAQQTLRNDLYRPLTGGQTGAIDIFGQDSVGGPRFTPPAGGGVMNPLLMPGAARIDPKGAKVDPKTDPNATPIEIDHLLLRFVDVDVKPGYSYEYQVRLRMLNPNFERKAEVANPAYAKERELYSPWAKTAESITVPAEAFMYSLDSAAYRKQTEEAFKADKDLLARFQVKDHQAVVEMCSWMEQVRTDGNKREPVGAWVVADIPVGRGEYVGRKQYVKLPLWSSELNNYVLREVPEKILVAKGSGKEPVQPRGWLVDFSTRSILVDFDGGRVSTKANGKTIVEDAASELLIVRPDGKLFVRSTQADADDENRKKIVADWDKWVKSVEGRPGGATGTGAGGEFGKQ